MVACGCWLAHCAHFHSLAHQQSSAVEEATGCRKGEDRCLPLLIFSKAGRNSNRSCADEICDGDITTAEQSLDFAERTFKPKLRDSRERWKGG